MTTNFSDVKYTRSVRVEDRKTAYEFSLEKTQVPETPGQSPEPRLLTGLVDATRFLRT